MPSIFPEAASLVKAGPTKPIAQIVNDVNTHIPKEGIYYYPFFSHDNPEVPILIKVDREKGEISIIDPNNQERGYVQTSVSKKGGILSFQKSYQIAVYKVDKEKLKKDTLHTLIDLSIPQGLTDHLPKLLAFFLNSSKKLDLDEGEIQEVKELEKQLKQKVPPPKS